VGCIISEIDYIINREWYWNLFVIWLIEFEEGIIQISYLSVSFVSFFIIFYLYELCACDHYFSKVSTCVLNNLIKIKEVFTEKMLFFLLCYSSDLTYFLIPKKRRFQ